MLKSPDRTNPIRAVLVAGGRNAITKKLGRREGREVLTRTPVKVAIKPVRARGERAILRTRAYTRGWRGGVTRVVTHRIELILRW